MQLGTRHHLACFPSYYFRWPHEYYANFRAELWQISAAPFCLPFFFETKGKRSTKRTGASDTCMWRNEATSPLLQQTCLPLFAHTRFHTKMFIRFLFSFPGVQSRCQRDFSGNDQPRRMRRWRGLTRKAAFVQFCRGQWAGGRAANRGGPLDRYNSALPKFCGNSQPD